MRSHLRPISARSPLTSTVLAVVAAVGTLNVAGCDDGKSSSEQARSAPLCTAGRGEGAAGAAWDMPLAQYVIPNLLTNGADYVYFPQGWQAGARVDSIYAMEPADGDGDGHPDYPFPTMLLLAKAQGFSGTDAASHFAAEAAGLVGTSLGAFAVTEAQVCRVTDRQNGGAAVIAVRALDADDNAVIGSVAAVSAIGTDGEVLTAVIMVDDDHAEDVGGIELAAAIMGAARPDVSPTVTHVEGGWETQATQSIGTALASAGPNLRALLNSLLSKDGFDWSSDD